MFHSYKSKSGNIVASLLMLVGATGFAVYFMDLMAERQKATKMYIDSTNYPIHVSSAAEGAMMVLRKAEEAYYKKVNSFYKASNRICTSSSNSFAQALETGVQCKDAEGRIVNFPAFSVFGANDWDANTTPSYIAYEANSKCIINSHTQNDESATNCRTLKFKVGVSDGEWKKYFGGLYTFEFKKVDSSSGVLVMDATPADGGRKFTIGFRWKSNNLAHIEPAGNITQENPDPSGMCAKEQRPNRTNKLVPPWGPLYIFDPETANCRQFKQFGSGRGLAFYHGKYFGVRQNDGQITLFDRLWSENKPYLVAEDGSLYSRGSSVDQNAEKVGFEYSREALVNADDITIVDGHIYLVSGQGRISFLKKGACPVSSNSSNSGNLTQFNGWCRVTVCNMSSLGYGVHYKGISAPGWTQSLFKQNGEKDLRNSRSANFYLKASAGNMYRVFVFNNPSSQNSSDYTSCTAVMDRQEQEVEYKRTYGFDRMDNERPYFIY